MAKFKSLYNTYWQNRLLAEAVKSDHLPNEILESIEPLLRKGKRLLDIGCGDGAIIEIAIDRYEEIHGCDISLNALSETKDMGMFSVCADLNEGCVPYKDDSFQCVTALELLEHIINPLRILAEIKRVLKPYGRLVLTTPNIRYFRNLHTLIFHGSFPHTTIDDFVWGGGHLHYFTRKDLSFLLGQAGFKRINFYINEKQFSRSWKRRFIRAIIGNYLFGEYFCGGIALEATKE
jgi:methionine biosynthesis protein MetW